MIRFRILVWCVLGAAAASLLPSCSNSTDGSNANYMGDLRIKLIDAPATYDGLVITIMRMEIHRKGFSGDLGWRVVTQQLARYDVLKLHNGVNAILVDDRVPIGVYDQVKLVFGPCEVVVAGSRQQVTVPPEIAAGWVLDYEFQVDEGKLFQLTFDIEPGRSVKSPTPGIYTLQPVFRVQATLLSGSIAGSVVGPDSMAALATISTSAGGDSISTQTDTTGNNGSFLLADIPEGSYTLFVKPSNPAFLDTTIVEVPVVRQAVKSVGSIRLRGR